jgi:hypothetical protein
MLAMHHLPALLLAAVQFPLPLPLLLLLLLLLLTCCSR